MSLVLFLRAVNVGGHQVFRPSLLARELAHLGVINLGAAVVAASMLSSRAWMYTSGS